MLRTRRINVKIKLYQHCFNVGHRHCINVVQCWKADVRFCFIFNIGSMLFQRWSTMLKQRWSNFEMLTGKASKYMEEILICAVQNGSSRIGKILEKSLCRSPVLETLCCNFVKTGLHRWHFPRKLAPFFGQTISQKHRWTTDWTWCSFV